MAEKRAWVQEAHVSHGLSERQACRLLAISRRVYRYRSRKNDAEVKAILKALAAAYPRWGFWKRYPLIRRQGKPWNPKRVLRVYREWGLNLRVKRKKRRPSRNPQP